MITTMFDTDASDADLVAQSLAGNRDAFGRIVVRYQSLICALAYNATGSLSQSEDLAQETFVAAWKDLAHLREPGKFRSWLCRIARNHIYDTLQKQGREPSHAAEPLDVLRQSAAIGLQPPQETISKEEQAILWRSMERLPDTYREPLILYYREHRSIGSVAAALELTEDAAKQRLARGRKLLHDEVLEFVEGALERTAPGKTFTIATLAALPLLTASANAAAIGATAAKGSALAKSAGLVALGSAILGPILMFVSTYFGYRLDHDTAGSPRRREFVKRYYRILVACIALFMAAVLLLTLGGRPVLKASPALYVGLLGGMGLIYILVVMAITLWLRRSLQRLRREEIAFNEPAPMLVPIIEYRSKCELFGLPLVHIRMRGGLERGPVKAWIAGGDGAIGAIFAFGGYAIAPISFGGFALGLIPLGGFAVGPLALGGFGLAIWAMGGLAAGWQAFGGCAVGWDAAMGGAALAHGFAIGGIAQAACANNDAAQVHIAAEWFFQAAQIVARHLVWLNVLWLLPVALWWRTGARARKRSSA